MYLPSVGFYRQVGPLQQISDNTVKFILKHSGGVACTLVGGVKRSIGQIGEVLDTGVVKVFWGLHGNCGHIHGHQALKFCWQKNVTAHASISNLTVFYFKFFWGVIDSSRVVYN